LLNIRTFTKGERKGKPAWVKRITDVKMLKLKDKKG